jgi:phosphoserine aminotransferase
MTEFRLPPAIPHQSVHSSHNFSAGPGALPDCVLQQLSAELIEVPEQNLSVLGISHRSDWFAAVVAETEERLRRLLQLDSDWQVLLLQGGSSLQFSMIPMNFLEKEASADYLKTGYWSQRSLDDPSLFGSVNVAWNGEACAFTRMPTEAELNLNPEAAYFHYISNETVEGLQFHSIPGIDGVPRFCDMSSDFLSRPLPVERFDLIYAHAQKNLGPAGLTIVLIRQSQMNRRRREVPSMLDYRRHRDAHSIFNTPPTFAIYATLLVLRWLEEDVGGLELMAVRNQRKAELINTAMDTSNGFYRGHAEYKSRSLMNVCFMLPSKQLEHAFLSDARRQGLLGLAGHRSLGGIRASLYNAVSEESCQLLVDFMAEFQARHAASSPPAKET